MEFNICAPPHLSLNLKVDLTKLTGLFLCVWLDIASWCHSNHGITTDLCVLPVVLVVVVHNHNDHNVR